jgi:hypothetical protein
MSSKSLPLVIVAAVLAAVLASGCADFAPEPDVNADFLAGLAFAGGFSRPVAHATGHPISYGGSIAGGPTTPLPPCSDVSGILCDPSY